MHKLEQVIEYRVLFLWKTNLLSKSLSELFWKTKNKSQRSLCSLRQTKQCCPLFMPMRPNEQTKQKNILFIFDVISTRLSKKSALSALVVASHFGQWDKIFRYIHIYQKKKHSYRHPNLYPLYGCLQIAKYFIYIPICGRANDFSWAKGFQQLIAQNCVFPQRTRKILKVTRRPVKWPTDLSQMI